VNRVPRDETTYLWSNDLMANWFSSRSLIVVLMLFGSGLAAVTAGEPVRGAPQHPNLLFVMPDQMRGQALGFLQEEPVLTPNLDRLATESLVLTQAISNYPVCSPCRGMLMTGLYPHRNHVLENCNSGSAPFGNELPQESVCWSDLLI
jgi:hypothetical protein